MEKTLTQFYGTLARNSGLDTTLLPRISRYVLRSLIERLHYTAAARLILELPSAMRDELFDAPAGPNPAITVSSICEGLMTRFSFSGEEAYASMFAVLRTLMELIDSEIFLGLLPRDFQLFIQSAARGNNALSRTGTGD